ncbi:hypothetical protein Tco_0008238 [Tanacetum coccineum]
MKRNESNQTRGGLNKKQKRGVTLKRKDVVTKVQKSVGKGKHKSAGKGKQKVSGGEAELGKRNKAIKREKGTMVDDDVDFNKKKHVLAASPNWYRLMENLHQTAPHQLPKRLSLAQNQCRQMCSEQTGVYESSEMEKSRIRPCYGRVGRILLLCLLVGNEEKP